MDPVSRRQVWNLIEKVKHGRVVVLTTHSMEEADILGDRIAIMRLGELSTVGSSVFLKNKFGSGFKLSLAHNNSTNAILPVLKDFLGQPKIASDADGVLVVDIGREQKDILPSLVNALEKQQEKIGVSNIELDISSLQEVFLKIAEEDEETVAVEPTFTSDKNPLLPTLDHSAVVAPATTRAPTYSFSNQMIALMQKSWLNQKRATKTNCAQIMIPASLILLLYVLQNFIINPAIAKQVAGGSVPAVPYPPNKSPVMFATDAAAWDACVAFRPFSNLTVDPAGATLKFSVSKDSQSNFIGNYGDSASFWKASSASGLLGNITRDTDAKLVDNGKGFYTRMGEEKGYVDMGKGGKIHCLMKCRIFMNGCWFPFL
jgi:energy-coupling factor transporter ATP-binding protein EcfA2